MDMDTLLESHRSIVLLIAFMVLFLLPLQYSPSHVRAAEGGRPGPLLQANLERYLTADVFTSRTMQ
jgi:hypothetical protein